MLFSPSHHILKNSSAFGLTVGHSTPDSIHLPRRIILKAAIVPMGRKEMIMRENAVAAVKMEAP